MILISFLTMGQSAGDPNQLVWSFGTGGVIVDVSVFADVNSDGEKDILVSSSDFSAYLLDGATGKKIWSFTGGSPTIGSFAVRDFTGDGNDDLVVGFSKGVIYGLNGVSGTKIYEMNLGSRLYSLKPLEKTQATKLVLLTEHSLSVVDASSGRSIWANPPTYSYSVVWHPRESIGVLGDVTGDGVPDVITTFNAFPRLSDGLTGASIWRDTRSCLGPYSGGSPSEQEEKRGASVEIACRLLPLPDISGDGYCRTKEDVSSPLRREG
ncbi:MAG: PQQ-binding-like beta-propeller repeat protein [Thaumarchaeota archaeon]|nr:PQQ-binding-like beta-propeller repeat protein [Nitrososphaerota archaeon]